VSPRSTCGGRGQSQVLSDRGRIRRFTNQLHRAFF